MQQAVARIASIFLSGAVATTAACGDGGAEDVRLVTKVRDDPSGVLRISATGCDVTDGRQLRAVGTVKNTGEKPYHVQLSVRFVDGDGTRVEIASDSVSDLESGETARWDASTYSDAAGDVESCEVTASGS